MNSIDLNALASAMHDAAIRYANGHTVDFQHEAREFAISAPAAQQAQGEAISDDRAQALWDEACKDGPGRPGWSRHLRFAKAVAHEAIGEFLQRSGQYITNDASREAAIAEAVAAAGHDATGAWQPIATAPKDCEVWAFNGEQGRMEWSEGEEWALWIWSESLLSDVDPEPEQPTHWLPLPAAPIAAAPNPEKEPR